MVGGVWPGDGDDEKQCFLWGLDAELSSVADEGGTDV